MERATGVEPATSSLGSWHSTTELHPLLGESRGRSLHCQLSTRGALASSGSSADTNGGAIDFAGLDPKTLGMTFRFSVRVARASRLSPQLSPRRAGLLLLGGGLALAAAGCFHSAVKPVAPTQQQMQAFSEQQTALRNEASHPTETPEEHCDQLTAATPGVEEIRINGSSIESRRWTLVSDGSAPRWAFVRTSAGPSDGWAPKPGLDKLNFQPPIETFLAGGSSQFVAYAPIDSQTVGDGQKSAVTREVFGPPQGQFSWRGRAFSYTVTPQLPCFSRMQ